MAKHRKSKPVTNYLKKAALAGGAAVTVTAMTAGVAAPTANAATVSQPQIPSLAIGQYIPGLNALSGVDLSNVTLGDLVGLLGQAGVAPEDLLAGLGSNSDLTPELAAAIVAALDLDLPVTVISTGPLFGVLHLVGLDLGTFVPGSPSLIAQQINGTPYTVDTRVPLVLAWGPGALATGAAYQLVLADLPNQPGGAANGAGLSVTVLPMVLLRNWGRANGGLSSRFSSLFGALGVNGVTPDVEVAESIHRGFLNLPDGVATLIPVKVDATAEFDAFSDAPSWANPVSMVNSSAAVLFPTYLLRGVDTARLVPQLDAIADDPLNIYLTLPMVGTPLLEPLKLPVDFINLIFGTNFSNPIADALEPAMRSLVNLGYTDVVRTPEGEYVRTLDQAGLNANAGGVPFGTLPSGIDWGQVPGDIFSLLVKGIADAFFNGGIPGVHDPVTDPQANPLVTLLRLLGVGQPITSLSDLGGVQTLAADTLNAHLPAAASIPADNPPEQTVTLSRLSAQSTTPQTDGQKPEATDDTDVDETPSAPSNPKPGPLLNVLRGNGNPAVPNAGAQLNNTVRNAQTQLQTAAENLQTELTNAAKRTSTALNNIGQSAADSLAKTAAGLGNLGKHPTTAGSDAQNGEKPGGEKPAAAGSQPAA